MQDSRKAKTVRISCCREAIKVVVETKLNDFLLKHVAAGLSTFSGLSAAKGIAGADLK
jgi:hypothetical protein